MKKLLLGITTIFFSTVFCCTPITKMALAEDDPFKDNHPEWFCGNSEIDTSINSSLHIVNKVPAGTHSDTKVLNIPSDSRPSSVFEIFDLTVNDSVSFSFSVPMYASGGSINFKSNNDNDSWQHFYLNVLDGDTNAVLMRVKWNLEASIYNNGDHPYQVSVGDGWDLVDGYDWLCGDATANSSFNFTFDKTNYLTSSFNKDPANIHTLDNSAGSDGIVKTYFSSIIGSITHIKFQITGDNGWDSEATIILNSINGKVFGEGEPEPEPEPEPSTNLPPVNEYTHAGSNYKLTYVDEGLKVDCTKKWDPSFDFGLFNLKYGFDLVVNIPLKNSLGRDNGLESFNIELVNSANSSYLMKFVIWVASSIGNAQSACEIYLNTPDGSYSISEIDDWIDRNVGGVDGTYHVAFDSTDFFTSESKGELIEIEKKGWANNEGLTQKQVINRILDSVPENSEFYLKCYGDRYSGFDALKQHTFIIQSLNDQSFELEDGELRSIIKPTTNFDDVGLNYETNKVYNFNCYVKDVLRFDSELHVRFLSEDKETEISHQVQHSRTNVSFTTPSQPGNYYLELFTMSRREKEAGLTGKKALAVVVKDYIQNIECTLVNPYKTSYEKNEKLTISEANYVGTNISSRNISVSYRGETLDVDAGTKLLLDKAGMYIVTYHAEDNARPTPNVFNEHYYINVIDREKPVISPVFSGNLRADELVKIDAGITDDTDFDVRIIITDSKGLKTSYSSSNVTFVPQEDGDYQITIRAEDSYGNVAVKNLIMRISPKAFNRVLLGWIIVGSVTGSLFLLFIGLSIAPKIKKGRR